MALESDPIDPQELSLAFALAAIAVAAKFSGSHTTTKAPPARSTFGAGAMQHGAAQHSTMFIKYLLLTTEPGKVYHSSDGLLLSGHLLLRASCRHEKLRQISSFSQTDSQTVGQTTGKQAGRVNRGPVCERDKSKINAARRAAQEVDEMR